MLLTMMITMLMIDNDDRRCVSQKGGGGAWTTARFGNRRVTWRAEVIVGGGFGGVVFGYLRRPT
jgi:hypothetical protein